MELKEKAELCVKRFQQVYDETKSIKIKEIAKVSKLFEVINTGSIDDPFEIKINGCNFHDEDMGTCCDDSNWSDKKLLANDYELEIEQIEDVVEKELTEEEIRKFKRLMVNIEAGFIIRMNNAINEDWIERFEKALTELKKEIPGYEWGEWDEMTMYFVIDDIRFSWDIGSDCVYEVEKDTEYQCSI